MKGLHMCAGLRGRSPRGESGAAAVEFALILPVLALLTFGLINMGWLFGEYLTLNSAVREGARRSVVESAATPGAIKSWVEAAAGEMIDSDAISYDPEPVPCSAVGDDLLVSVVYDTDWLIEFDFFFEVPAPPIHATSVFRCEVD